MLTKIALNFIHSNTIDNLLKFVTVLVSILCQEYEMKPVLFGLLQSEPSLQRLKGLSQDEFMVIAIMFLLNAKKLSSLIQ